MRTEFKDGVFVYLLVGIYLLIFIFLFTMEHVTKVASTIALVYLVTRFNRKDFLKSDINIFILFTSSILFSAFIYDYEILKSLAFSYAVIVVGFVFFEFYEIYFNKNKSYFNRLLRKIISAKKLIKRYDVDIKLKDQLVDLVLYENQTYLKKLRIFLFISLLFLYIFTCIASVYEPLGFFFIIVSSVSLVGALAYYLETKRKLNCYAYNK